jgi:hypothetical protein
LFLWEREGKRGYQFEDGEVRTIADGFYHLLEPAVTVDAELRVRLRRLAEANGEADETKGVWERKDKTPRAKIADQIAMFLAAFPGGFADEAWRSGHRGGGTRRRVKQHREPALADAGHLLAADALRELVRDRRYDTLQERLVAVLEATDLVTKSQLGALRQLRFDARLAAAFVAFLHGDDEDPVRFSELRRALAVAGLKTPAWPLVTGLLSLVRPADEVCVRPSVFEPQAKIAGLAGKRGRQPSCDDYIAYRAVAGWVREQLIERGLEPADMLDMHDFILYTLRRGGRDDLDAAMVARLDAESSERDAA